jgi:signal peptidase II
MAKKNNSGLTWWLCLATLIMVVDQLTKILAVRSFQIGERKAIIPGFFDLTLLYNKGAAFSFLAGAGGWQRWFFTIFGLIASIVIIWMLAKHGGQKLFATALTLILGGAVGNVIDRVYQGQVTDFLLFYHDRWFFPAFNVADSAITVGAILLILDELLRVRRSR